MTYVHFKSITRSWAFTDVGIVFLLFFLFTSMLFCFFFPSLFVSLCFVLLFFSPIKYSYKWMFSPNVEDRITGVYLHIFFFSYFLPSVLHLILIIAYSNFWYHAPHKSSKALHPPPSKSCRIPKPNYKLAKRCHFFPHLSKHTHTHTVTLKHLSVSASEVAPLSRGNCTDPSICTVSATC